MPSRRQSARSALWLAMAVAARAAALPVVERQDVTTAAPTRTIANRATAEAVTTTEVDDATTSAAGKVGMRLGPKIAAIFIPILFFLVVFWLCSPWGPEGKRRRRRRENLARLRANLDMRERERAQAAALAAQSDAQPQPSAQAGTAGMQAGNDGAERSRDDARTRRANVVYLYTGLGRNEDQQLPAYHHAPADNEVSLAQGARSAVNPAAPPITRTSDDAPAHLHPPESHASEFSTAGRVSPSIHVPPSPALHPDSSPESPASNSSSAPVLPPSTTTDSPRAATAPPVHSGSQPPPYNNST